MIKTTGYSNGVTDENGYLNLKTFSKSSPMIDIMISIIATLKEK
jgi:hypothetical protein